MEFVCEPNRFQRILNVALIGGKIESCASYFRPDGLYVEDKSQQTIGVKAFFPVKYFINYKVDGDEEKLQLSKTMLEPFGWGEAFEEAKLKVHIKDGKLYYEAIDKQGKTDEFWKNDLEEVKENKFNFQIPSSEKGFIPSGKPELAQVFLRASQLKIHTADRYKFIGDDGKMEVEVQNPGVYKRALQLTKAVKLSKLELAVPGDDLETIVGLYTGDVWLTLYAGGVVFSQKTEEGAISYLLSPFTEA